MRTRMSFGRIGIALVAATLTATATGHHSTAEFDYTKQLTIKGTVKELQWTNPHSFVQVIVEDKGKEPVEWSVEIGSPSINTALGWKKTSVKRGDVVTLLLSPARNGSPYGTLRKLTFEDGRELIGVAGRTRSTPAPAPAQGR
jgi:ABC-type glycerol-3-phosphate transport system substrate-binding protein